VRGEVLALPLDRDGDADTEPEPFTAGELLDHVSGRRATALLPAALLGRPVKAAQRARGRVRPHRTVAA
jgi:hypothetical protein